MNYSSIILFDVANGPGIRTSLFVSGCNFHCEGCFNQEAQDFSFGHEFTKVEESLILERIKNPDYSGLSLLGGDPFCQTSEDLEKLYQLCSAVKLNSKNIWAWTGYTWETLLELEKQDFNLKLFLHSIDYLVDGRFELDKRDLDLSWRGSTNQRIIDVQASLKTNTIVEYKI